MVHKKRKNFIAILLLVFALVLTSAILAFGSWGLNNADAYLSGGVPGSIGSLTYSDYATRSDGAVFDPAILQALFGKITGKATDTYQNALATVKGSTSTLTGYSKGNADNVQPYTMDFSMINGGNPITVEFGGFKWDVVYLTTNTVGNTAGNGDLIATLWMSEIKGTSVWSPMTSATTAYAPGNYGTSQVRIKALNAGSTDYVPTTYPTNTSGAVATVNAVDRVNNQFAHLTLSNATLEGTTKENCSLIDYIATPSQLQYQRVQNSIWGHNKNGGWSVNLFPNEAWGDGTDGVTGPNESLVNSTTNSSGWASNVMKSVKSMAGYYDWKDDYLWLPSMTETGWANDSTHESDTSYNLSWWGIPNKHAMLYSDGPTPTAARTGTNTTSPTSSNPLTPTGGLKSQATTTTFNLRPAIHLNLTAVAELKIPDTIELVYDGNPKEVDDLDWWAGLYSSALEDPVYYNVGGATEISAPTVVGNYEVALTIKSTAPQIWNDGNASSATRRVKLNISKKPIDLPTFDEATLVYKGGGALPFYLNGYDNDIMKDIVVPSQYDGVDFHNTGDPYISATYADKYEFDVELRDTANYTWSTKYKKLECEVEKYPIKLSIDDGSLNYELTGPQGATISAYLEVDTSHNVHDGKTVTALIMAYRSGVTRGTKIGEIDLTASSGRESVMLDLSDLRADMQYALGVEIDEKKYDGANYCAEVISTTTLDVTDPSLRNNITWRLTADGTIVANQISYSEVHEYSKNFDGKPIVYDGRKYVFVITPPNGYTLDTDYGVDGYLVAPDAISPSSPYVCIYADSYTTSIRLINDTTQQKQVYTLNWEIEKAKFDLSNVKWLGNGKLEYDDGNAVEFTIDETTLPDGLLVDHYDGVNTGYDVGSFAPVTVTFKLDNGYEDNYVLPEQGENNYVFNGTGDFDWEKEWEIVPGIFKLEWVKEEKTDKNGNTFNVYVLKDPRAVGKVSYTYYPTNSSGQIDTSKTPLSLDDIEVSATDRQYFKALPAINRGFENFYEFANNNTPDYSPVFDVGGGASSVRVSLEKDKYEYNNGKPVSLKISINGTATLNQLSLTYYSGDVVADANKLDGAPTDVGNYLVVIKSTTSTVVLGGTTQFEFEITQCRIPIDWNTDAKPPVLNLKYGQINGVEYEIYDNAGNKISNMSQIVPGDYTILAKIKDSQVQNYIFEDDTYVTAFVDFTVREGDELYDPNSPTNPHYPQTDPDDPSTVNPGDNGDGGNGGSSFLDKLLASHFPLWQVITMAVSAILAIIFIAKAVQYGSRAKQAKNDAKKLNAKTYATFLPIFSTEVVALGLTNKLWSIMAFAFAGFATLTFAVALLMRIRWKRAEAAREAAIEDSEQRKLDAQEAKQLAREEAQEARQRELQETLIMASQGGGQGADNSAVIEQMRMEMEAREARYREELARRDEEQAKRDETMKIMLANLMGRSAGDDTYAYATMDDTDMLVQRVIAGLLPAMQQMMPEATAYLNAPNSEENEELKALVEEQKALVEEQRAIVEEQNEEIRNISIQMIEMQAQLEAMSQERENVIIEGGASEEQIAEMAETMQQQLEKIDELQTQIEEMSQNNEVDNSEEMQAMADAMREQLAKIEELQAQLAAMEQKRVDGVLLPDQSDDMKAMLAKMDELQAQLAAGAQEDGEGIVISDQSEEIKALTEQIAAMREQLAERPQTITHTVYVERETDEEDNDDEEEWDSILDEEDDFIEATVIDEDGTVRKTTPNFRMRLKESSDKNREWYSAIKNLFCSQKGVTYRVYKRVEKIRYQGQVIAVIGIAKRSIKLWLALKPYEYDARRYHHKDVSDKPRFVDVPLFVRVGSDRALTRAEELILALFQEQAMESRKRYNDRSIQELIFTLKHNRLLGNKETKQLLCEVMHVHDCDVLDDETAEKCIESKNVDFIDDSVIEQVKLDDIDANFQDGNRVTLDKLRKAGLVSEQCTGYTVVAGQRLTKPLIIVANDFTMEAIKLIALTGGRVIKLNKI